MGKHVRRVVVRLNSGTPIDPLPQLWPTFDRLPLAAGVLAACDVSVVARRLGYKLKPSEVPGTAVGRVAEGAAGSPRLSNEASVANQKTTNRLAAKEIGLSPDEPITRAALSRAKAPHNAVYDEVSKLGHIDTDEEYHQDIDDAGWKPGSSFPGADDASLATLKKAHDVSSFSAKDAVQQVRKLRAAAGKNIKAPNDPERNERGFTQLGIAEALESQLERAAQKAGKANLVQRLRSARTHPRGRCGVLQRHRL